MCFATTGSQGEKSSMSLSTSLLRKLWRALTILQIHFLMKWMYGWKFAFYVNLHAEKCFWATMRLMHTVYERSWLVNKCSGKQLNKILLTKYCCGELLLMQLCDRTECRVSLSPVYLYLIYIAKVALLAVTDCISFHKLILI